MKATQTEYGERRSDQDPIRSLVDRITMCALLFGLVCACAHTNYSRWMHSNVTAVGHYLPIGSHAQVFIFNVQWPTPSTLYFYCFGVTFFLLLFRFQQHNRLHQPQERTLDQLSIYEASASNNNSDNTKLPYFIDLSLIFVFFQCIGEWMSEWVSDWV